jgi:hypothetical protein
MTTLHQIHKVKDGKIVVHLPAEYNANEVEVIITPVKKGGSSTAHTAEEEAIQHLLNLDTSHFTEAQKKAYQRTCQLLRQKRRPDEPRLLGLFEGLFEIGDDFNDPLPDEGSFWGEETDEYGMTISS